MKWLVMIVVLVVALESLRIHISPLAHIVSLVPVALGLKFLQVTRRPLRACPNCDKGRNWDNAHQNFGETCRRCGARGKVLRPGAQLLRAFGAGRQLRNLPDSMRGTSDDDTT